MPKLEATPATIRSNITHLIDQAGDSRATFAEKTKLSISVVQRLLSKGFKDYNYNHTVPIERAYQLRSHSLLSRPQRFQEYLRTWDKLPPLMPPPYAVEQAWPETLDLANDLMQYKSIFLYYWSRTDKSIIGNKCAVEKHETGIRFSFLNPMHDGPSASKHKDNIDVKYLGYMRAIKCKSLVCFEAFSDHGSPEPVFGIGKRGNSENPGLLRGKMIGLRSKNDNERPVSSFRFIILSDPATAIQKTDRIPAKDLPDPLATYFKKEIKKLDKPRLRSSQS